jgi:hypothetical protein
MRTKTLLAAAAMLAAGLASSMAQSNVYSLNVVGYVNKVLVGGNKYTAAANPLNTATNTLAGLFGGPGVGLPATTRVLKWNTGIADFDTFTKTSFGTGWSGPGAGAATSLNPGEGCLILTPVGSADLTNTFVGEVLQGSLTNSFITGYQMAGNKVPDSGAVDTLGLVPPASTPATRLLKWDSSLATQGDWVTYTKTTFGLGWSPSVPNINVAEGFLLNAGTAFSWVRNFTVQ